MNSPSGNKRAKALDVLEKHISQQNKRPKSSKYGSLSSMFQTISESTRLPAPTTQHDRRQNFSSPPRRPEQLSPTRFRATRDSPMTTSTKSSPLKKSVAFSDQIDSSPPRPSRESSPRASSQNPIPSKPILKLPSSSIRMASPRRRGDFENPRLEATIQDIRDEEAAYPMSLKYWVCGEVHALKDIKSVSEFKAIVNGGLFFLTSDHSEARKRHFEIYATLNNIMPVSTSMNYSEVKDRKVHIIVQNMNVILSTCLQHLVEAQSTLLSSVKKDPFISRTYVQIVRFFNALLSNFTIVKALENKQVFLQALHQIVDQFTQSIQHPNCNKVMITAQLALLRDEQCGIKNLGEECLKRFIIAITRMKRIASSNLTCEKLLLLKIFLGKYPALMLSIVDLWLPTEVLSKLLIEEEYYSLKIASNCISILLDLLKRCLINRTYHKVLRILEEKDATQALLSGYTDKPISDKELCTSTSMENLLCNRIVYLVEEKDEPKLAMSLWLAIVGLLFNSEKKMEALCIEESGNQWINLNLKYQASGDSSLSKVALRSWRIVTYIICSKDLIKGDELSQNLINVLLKPFELAGNETSYTTSQEQYCYLLRGIFYMIFSNGDTDKLDFSLQYILAPLLLHSLRRNECNSIRSSALEILLRLVRPKHSHIVKKDLNPLKVVASCGVDLEDFTTLSQPALNGSWLTLMQIVCNNDLVSAPQTSGLVYSLVLRMIESVPQTSINIESRDYCANILISFFDGATVGKELRIKQGICVMMGTFKSLMCDASSSMIKFRAEIFRAVETVDGLDCTTLLKATVKELNGEVSDLEIYHFFLGLRDIAMTSFISNAISSKILSPKMPSDDFEALIGIVNLCPIPTIISNFLNICERGNFGLDPTSAIDLLPWDVEFIVRYWRLRLRDRNRLMDDKFLLQLITTLQLHDKMISCLHDYLDGDEYAHLALKALLFESQTCQKELSATGTSPTWFELAIRNYPAEELLKLPGCFQLLRPDIQKCFILKTGKLDFEGRNELSSVFIQKFVDSNTDTYRANPRLHDQIMIDILKESVIDKQLNEVLNQAIMSLISCGVTGPVISQWKSCGPSILPLLDSSTLGVMLSTLKEVEGSIITALCASLKNQSSSYTFEVLEKVVCLKRTDVFASCRDQILQYLIDKASVDDDSCSEKVLSFIRSASEVLVFQNKKVLAEVMRNLLTRQPAKKGSFIYELITSICHDPRFNLKGYDKLLVSIKQGKPMDLDCDHNENKKETRRYRFHSIPKSPLSSINQTASQRAQDKRRKSTIEESNFDEANRSKPPDSPAEVQLLKNAIGSSPFNGVSKNSATSFSAQKNATENGVNHQLTSTSDSKLTQRLITKPLNTNIKPVDASCQEASVLLLNRPEKVPRCEKSATVPLQSDLRPAASAPSIVGDQRCEASDSITSDSALDSPSKTIKNTEKYVGGLAYPDSPRNTTSSSFEPNKVSKNPSVDENNPQVNAAKHSNKSTPDNYGLGTKVVSDANVRVSVPKDTRYFGNEGTLPPSMIKIQSKKSGMPLNDFENVLTKTDGSKASEVAEDLHKRSPNARVDFRREPAMKIPIFNSLKVKAKTAAKHNEKAQSGLLPIIGKPTMQRSVPHGDSSNLASEQRLMVDLSALSDGGNEGAALNSNSDKQLRLLLQIMKSFGKSEFSELTDAQKRFLKSELIRFLSQSKTVQSD